MSESKSSQHGTIRPLKQRIEALENDLDQTRAGYELQVLMLSAAILAGTLTCPALDSNADRSVDFIG